MQPRRFSFAFSRIELLLLLATLAVLALVRLSALANSKGPGQSAVCQNNLRQLGTAVLMYSSENGGYFPPRSYPERWPEKLRSYYRDLNFLRCPSDGPNPRTSYSGTAFPGDCAPRSYLYNGWNDYFYQQLGGGFPGNMSNNSIPESVLKEPIATILIGEKRTESMHFYMDLMESVGNDLDEVEHRRHFQDQSRQYSGGANYAFADGGVRFLKYYGDLSPTNLWAVIPAWRYPIP